MKIRTIAVLAIGVIASCAGGTDATTAAAETSALGSDGGMPNGPPPQAAIDACQSQSQGDACSFTANDCSVTGTCQGPQGKPLACAPNGPPPQGAIGSDGGMPNGPPPQAALDACESLSQDATCSFTGDNGSVTGTCQGPDGKPLACVPSGPPPPPQAALDACESLSQDAACSFTGSNGSVTGTCQAPQGKPLACAPANGQPPPQG